jgi:hypothetical protein
MWRSWVKRKGTTQLMYIAKLKDGPKRGKKTFSMILERVFEMVWWRGRKSHQKRFFKLTCFSTLGILTSPLFEETLGDFLFLSLFPFSFFSFQSFFSLFFSTLCLLRTWGFWWYLRRKITSSKTFFSNGLTWIGMAMAVDIFVMDAHSGMELCTLI